MTEGPALEKGVTERVAVIGAGTMGPGIAQVFAQAKRSVRLCDLSREALDKARSVIRINLETLASNDVLAPSDIDPAEARIACTTSLEEAAQEADLVVECITEDRERKRSLFRALDPICGRRTIFASNTSYLNVFELVPPERLATTVVAHWFAPPHILPLVEVVRDAATSDQTVASVVDLLKQVGKTPVVMEKFVPGFAVNRLQRILGREIFFLLDNGYITADQLDLAVKASIAPRMMLLGLVQRYDFTGLDLSAKNLENEEFSEAPMDNRPKSLLGLVEQGAFGVKSGRGFYDYSGKSFEELLRERDSLLIQVLKNTQFCLTRTIGKNSGEE